MANENSGLFSCRTTCWIAGGLLGVAVFLLINDPWVWAVIVGVVVAVVIALVLQRVFCSSTGAQSGLSAATPEPARPHAPAAHVTKPVVTPPMNEVEADEMFVGIEPEDEPVAHDVPAAAVDGPELLDAPRGGAADDLKMIKGVGPGIEKKLHDAGVYHFDQIAAWTEADIAVMDDKLTFRGRITRDDWIAQAKQLAEGGETEFSKKASKSGLYDDKK